MAIFWQSCVLLNAPRVDLFTAGTLIPGASKGFASASGAKKIDHNDSGYVHLACYVLYNLC
jgi:hypothetical protein